MTNQRIWCQLVWFVLAASLSLSSCKSRTSNSSSLRGLKGADGYAVARFDDPRERAKTPVLIYYLNESDYAPFTPEVRPRMSWLSFQSARSTECDGQGLSASDVLVLRKVFQRINSDVTEFLDAGSDETASLMLDYKDSSKLKTFIFTNERTKRSAGGIFRGPDNDMTWENFPALAPGAPEVYRYQPLMRPEVLNSAIEQVKRVAPPDKHRYILIAKSHGNATMALTAFLARDISNLSGRQICEAVLAHQRAIEKKGSGQATSSTMGKDDDSPMGKDDDSPMGKDDDSPMGKDDDSPMGKDSSAPLGTMSAVDYLGQVAAGKQGLDAPNSKSPLPGITKKEFSDILIRHREMYFPIVMMESCKSEGLFVDQIKSVKADRAVPNISYVYTSNSGGLNYVNLNYKALFNGIKSGGDLQDVLKSMLDYVSGLSLGKLGTHN